MPVMSVHRIHVQRPSSCNGGDLLAWEQSADALNALGQEPEPWSPQP
ncbi:hypothetical protein POX_e07200 [Penicillium oxalicum]|nr:hypothetical protein POX_e07200 [Penicillium oxalicum]KAI2789172.1 hypothetical protein POX_e07200 [Penicillium oxalicum]